MNLSYPLKKAVLRPDIARKIRSAKERVQYSIGNARENLSADYGTANARSADSAGNGLNAASVTAVRDQKSAPEL